MTYDFSFIIPVFDRPNEINELLNSFIKVKGIKACEIVIVEDGSIDTCKEVVDKYKDKLSVVYYYKQNTGPGDSRNFGMKKAKSEYYIILDSDVLVPENYLESLKSHLRTEYADCFGGPDAAHKSFSKIQKAINYSMTSLWTTGGIRGKKNQKQNFQPRSFNMGLSKKAFESSGGFSFIHPGEDPDLALRLNKLNFKTALYHNCFVYHKRRINWSKFSQQMYKFGLVRPILNLWHPKSHKLVYYFPTLFTLGLFLSIVLLLFDFKWLFVFYILYFSLLFLDALLKEKDLIVASLAILAVFVQFFSYGKGYFLSTVNVLLLRKNPRSIYPNLFFNQKS